jgi:MFS family permease
LLAVSEGFEEGAPVSLRAGVAGRRQHGVGGWIRRSTGVSAKRSNGSQSQNGSGSRGRSADTDDEPAETARDEGFWFRPRVPMPPIADAPTAEMPIVAPPASEPTVDLGRAAAPRPPNAPNGTVYDGRHRLARDAAEQETRTSYREVFASREYRALYSGQVLSSLGDQLAKVAVAVLVFDRTSSALAAAAAFAIGYLPHVVGGPVLAALAERWPRRRTLIVCDVLRAFLVASLVIPGVPIPVLLAVLFTTALLDPPFISVRAALLPEILPGDRYVAANTLAGITMQVLQLVGFVLGGAIVAIMTARGALVIDAGTFVLSALLLRIGVRERPGPRSSGRGSRVLSDVLDGARFVFTDRVLRMYLVATWLATGLVFAPEGIAAPYASHLGYGAVAVGLLLAANPVGMILGGLVLGRMVTPRQRLMLLRPLAVFTTVPLIAILLDPPLPVVLVLLFLSGIGVSFTMPLNALFVRAVPSEVRTRAFAVANGGMLVAQGICIVVAGLLADMLSVTLVIGVVGIVGAVTMALVMTQWPAVDEHPSAAPAAAGGQGE